MEALIIVRAGVALLPTEGGAVHKQNGMESNSIPNVFRGDSSGYRSLVTGYWSLFTVHFPIR